VDEEDVDLMQFRNGHRNVAVQAGDQTVEKLQERTSCTGYLKVVW
jgi:hypothetical protein